MSATSMFEKGHAKEFILDLLKDQSENRDIEKLRGLYESWATNYDEDMAEINTFPSINFAADYIASKIQRKDARVLDCGSGTGLLGEALAKRGFTKIDAMDLSPSSLEVAKQKGVYQDLIPGDVRQELKKIPDNYYDGIASTGCFGPGHLTADIFPDWARIVKSGGAICFTIREEYFQQVPEHNDGKLEAAIRKLEAEGKWTFSKESHKNYGYGYDGILMEFVVN